MDSTFVPTNTDANANADADTDTSDTGPPPPTITPAAAPSSPAPRCRALGGSPKLPSPASASLSPSTTPAGCTWSAATTSAASMATPSSTTSPTGTDGVQVVPPGTLDVNAYYWDTNALGWVVRHRDSASGLFEDAFSPGSFVRSASALMPLPTEEPALVMQWDHELRVVHRTASLTWNRLLIGAGPTEACLAPPSAPGDVCQHDEGYYAPIATWHEGDGARIVYGSYVRSGERTAIYAPGPAGGSYQWSEPPPWTGTVEVVSWDPALDLGTPVVLLDGVVASAGQAALDGTGLVQIAMKDHACDAFDDWATRVAVIDPTALP